MFLLCKEYGFYSDFPKTHSLCILEKLIISRCAKTKSHFLTFGFCNITKKLFRREIQFHISINNQSEYPTESCMYILHNIEFNTM